MEDKCWICKRDIPEVIEEFNKIVLENPYISDDTKSKYEKGKKEFFPKCFDRFVGVLLADVKEGIYSISGKPIESIRITLCPICEGLFEDSIEEHEERLHDFIRKEDLKNVSIVID